LYVNVESGKKVGGMSQVGWGRFMMLAAIELARRHGDPKLREELRLDLARSDESSVVYWNVGASKVAAGLVESYSLGEAAGELPARLLEVLRHPGDFERKGGLEDALGDAFLPLRVTRPDDLELYP